MVSLSLAQAGRPQPGDQLAAADGAGSECDGSIAHLGRQVVVVALECPAWDAQCRGEGMQLVVRRVADQMAPKPVTKRPDGFVHEHGHGHNAAVTECLLAARALVVHDLAARGMDTAHNVSIVDEVLSARRWWVEQWPDGQAFVACLVAQDVQEALLETVGRWPLCSLHEDGDDPHELRVTPDLGPDPQWMCEEDGCVVAPVGALSV